MVDRNEALIASGVTSLSIAGTYIIANRVVFPGQEGALALTVFSASFTLSYLGMRDLLPF